MRTMATMFYDDEKFCSNERCPLHVSANDPHVSGAGQWATLPNGLMYSRVLRDDRYYCDACAEDPDNPPIMDLFAS